MSAPPPPPPWRRWWSAAARSRPAGWWARAARASELRPAPLEPWLPPGLSFEPPAPSADQRFADQRFAEDVYRGRMRLAGHTVELHGASPFHVPPAPPAWRDVPPAWPDAPAAWHDALHGFAWLRPMHDAGTPLARANAQALVADWLATFGTRLAHPAWAPAVAAARLDSWLTHHAWLCAGPGGGASGGASGGTSGGGGQSGGGGLDRQRLLRAVAQHVRALRLAGPSLGGLAGAQVAASVALAQALADARPPRAPSRGLVATLHEQPPREALLLWSRLARATTAADAAAVGGSSASGVAPELAAWLGAQRHADGTFARFVQNDHPPLAPTPPALHAALDAALETVDLSAPHPLVRRHEVEGSVLLVAAAASPNVGALELSDRGGRLVCSCGRSPDLAPALAAALASPRAHSTLTLEAPDQPDAGPSLPSRARVSGAGPLDVVHDRFRGIGVVHSRMLDLSPEGLNGMDTLAVAPDAPAATARREVVVRFHLHPSVSPEASGEHAVRLRRASGGGASGAGAWTFFCLDASVSLEETALFAETSAPVPSRQIVLRRPLGEGGEIRWALARAPAPAKARETERGVSGKADA